MNDHWYGRYFCAPFYCISGTSENTVIPNGSNGDDPDEAVIAPEFEGDSVKKKTATSKGAKLYKKDKVIPEKNNQCHGEGPQQGLEQDPDQEQTEETSTGRPKSSDIGREESGGQQQQRGDDRSREGGLRNPSGRRRR